MVTHILAALPGTPEASTANPVTAPMLLQLLSGVINVLGSTTIEGWCMATGILVRLRPEAAAAYPWVPAGVWLAAHCRDGDEGVVWLDAPPTSGHDLPLFTQHLEIRVTGDREPG
jgi:hypothetical protein